MTKDSVYRWSYYNLIYCKFVIEHVYILYSVLQSFVIIISKAAHTSKTTLQSTKVMSLVLRTGKRELSQVHNYWSTLYWLTKKSEYACVCMNVYRRLTVSSWKFVIFKRGHRLSCILESWQTKNIKCHSED